VAYGPVLAYKRLPSHDSHGPCWQGGCVREEAFWEGLKAERPVHPRDPRSPMYVVLSCRLTLEAVIENESLTGAPVCDMLLSPIDR
jgi:hypothetical protein